MGRCHIHVAVADLEHFPALGRHAQFLHQGAGALGCGFGGHIGQCAAHDLKHPNPLVVAQRNNKKPQTIHYAYTVPYSSWMKNSQMLVAHDACGCNQTLLDEGILNSLGNALS